MIDTSPTLSISFPASFLHSAIVATHPLSMLRKISWYGYVKISQEISQKRTRERMSDQEAKDLKAEAREIMPQPSTVNCKKPQSTKPIILKPYQ
ncbi:hypothetical protein Tco_1094056 [Tanacetum coccineum]|uniref:Uncharacterized protein n=1 Tax=Tanacetum coccineum TaxID=301880 RepID=A0ABQ5IEG4_9ASTR